MVQMSLYSGQEYVDEENGCGDAGTGRNWRLKRHDTAVCKIVWWEPAVKRSKLSLVLCNDLEGKWGGGRRKRERIYVCVQLAHLVEQQRLTQHRKAIMLQ